MKKVAALTLSAGLVFGFLFVSGNKAEGASVVVKTYKNCTELNKVYKGGVSRAANVVNKGGKTKYKPFAHKALYDKNKKSDRDKDGIACER